MTQHTETVNTIPVHYVAHGEGMPILALHGGYVDHQEIMGCLEPLFRERSGYQRIYPDLPGMGRTPAPETVVGSDDILAILLGFIDAVIGEQAFLVVAHSYGGYLGRAIANRRAGQVAGVALICPVMAMGEDSGQQVAEHIILHADAEIEGKLEPEADAEFRGYFVVQTAETLKRYQESVAPGSALVDFGALSRIFDHWQLSSPPETGEAYPHPALILLGGHDSTVGYTDQWRLLEHYPRATFAVLEGAGHALPHEQIALFNALMSDWLRRVAEHGAG